jgi:hypothetical protein
LFTGKEMAIEKKSLEIGSQLVASQLALQKKRRLVRD